MSSVLDLKQLKTVNVESCNHVYCAIIYIDLHLNAFWYGVYMFFLIKITLWNQNMVGSILWQFFEFSIFLEF
jgi:hypothetical protein